MLRRYWPIAFVIALAVAGSSVQTRSPARAARISEEVQTITTYPFSEPNTIPILTRDTRLYPYHSFEGYAHEGLPRAWKVVRLENDWIEVFVLPEVGGKVWGARVKKTGHEFIYRNEVLKFRNIALRGPWTSGGIEFNFGVIGHTPSTATPVDYALERNPDGSVSCVVGTMDLPSRTEWRVEIRLPADKAVFETNVLWHNPTPLEQPYYNWMTAAAFARDDLEMSIPGNAYLEHPGARQSWPVDDRGRVLPVYRNNTFGSNKSFHVVGELKDTFGGYYRDAGYGFGHWARYEEMPGQKLWLWALSRSGGIWEDLLTDTDGQYVEYQAGRLFVQYSPGADVNPIKQAGFDPLATDRWTETWFPLEGLGGLTEASRDGAIAVREDNGRLQIGVTAFGQASDTLRVWSGGTLVLEQPVSLAPLEPFTTRIDHVAGSPYRVELRALGIDYSPDPSSRTLSRPFETDPAAVPSIPETDRLVFEARELIQGRRYEDARPMLEKALAARPWHRAALLALGDLEYRRARYDEGLAHVTRALQLDTYDADANFIAGNLYRALGKTADARDAFGWAARSMAYRSAANVQLADLALARGDWAEAERYARIALDYNRLSLSAWDILAIVGRKTGNRTLVETTSVELTGLDPLHHLIRAEAYLAQPTAATLAAFTTGLRSEYPDQTILELAIGYVNRGLRDDAMVLLAATASRFHNPLLRAWLAYLKQDASMLAPSADAALVFPYRRETLPVLSWAAKQNPHWSWTYLLALNLWAFDRPDEAGGLLRPLGTTPTLPAFYVSRAFLVERAGGDPEPDLRQADRIGGGDRPVHLPLIQYYQRVGRWADALEVSGRVRTRFPDDFNLALLHARSLIQLGRATEALAVLDTTRVLPSENARDSHQMYVQAHVLAALAAIDQARPDGAYSHLTAALDWPEHLGQGRPYAPEERLIRFLMGRIDERRGRAADARREFEAVVAAASPAGAGLARLDLLAIPALRALGRAQDIDRTLLAASARPTADPGLRQMAGALARAEAIENIAAANPRQFGDLDGTLLVRALSLAGR
jgi:tetratricopeptide (TPR) repeat protein